MPRFSFTGRKSASEEFVVPLSDTSTSSKEESQSSKPIRRNVSFGDRLEIMEFPIVLGDSVCSSGAPVQISWKPSKTITRNLEMHELCREHQAANGNGRRSKKELLLSVQKRALMLVNAGFDETQINDATESAKLIRQYRRENRYM